jgi:hypothetical protein
MKHDASRDRCSRASTLAFAQAKPAAPKKDLVEFEMMTWPEVKAAMAAGKTTALFYTGGTEQRGTAERERRPHADGPRNRENHRAAAGQRDRDAGAAVHPNNASADLPGTIGLTPELLGAILERVTEQAMATGFRNVVLMGDHGGGQPATYAEVAKKMDAKYSAEGKHVYFCDEVYAKAQGDFDKWLQEKGYPTSSHAGIPDTSTMLYLGGDKGWVRKELISTAEGDPRRRPARAVAAAGRRIPTRRPGRTTASPAMRAARPRRWARWPSISRSTTR